MSDEAPIKAGVIGWPVSHSLSPRLHGYWLKKHDVNGTYDAIPVEPADSKQMLKMLSERGYKGANITVPYKETMFQLLDDVDDTARRIGAVNTIVCEDGKWRGTNTDAYGFMENLGANSDVWKEGMALVIGAGGAARAICVGLLGAGFSVTLVNRSPEKAEMLKNFLQHKDLHVKSFAEMEAVLPECSLVVNTTTLGMKGQPLLDVSLKMLPKEAYVVDIVYNPERTARTRRFSNPTTTDFLARAAENGNQTVDGLGMLLYQAQAGFEMWYGVRPDVTRALRSHVLGGLFDEQDSA